MSYRPMVYVGGGWAGNALRFATEEEARASACDLYSRWTLCEDYRADPSDDPVNCVREDSAKEVSDAYLPNV
jgi:hypothetical protein